MENEQVSKAQVLRILCRRFVQTLWKTAGAFSVGQYHLWTSIVYICCGGFLLYAYPVIHVQFCEMPLVEECDTCVDTFLTCGSSQCFQSSLNITYLEVASTPKGGSFQAFHSAIKDDACNTVVGSANNPIQLLTLMMREPTISKACKSYHCENLERMAEKSMTDIFNGNDTCTNEYLIKSQEMAEECLCIGDLRSAHQFLEEVEEVCGVTTVQTICASYTTTPSACDPYVSTTSSTTTITTTTTTTTTTSTTAASGGRLLEQQEPEVLIQSGMHHEVSDSGRALTQTNTQTQVTIASSADAPTPWTIGDWSPCTCYLQCTPGVMTRSVTCGASTCRGDAPATQQTCTCTHCAQCFGFEGSLSLLSFLLPAQGLIAFLLMVLYMLFAEMDEDLLIKLTIVRRIGGFFCKTLPFLVYLGDVTSLGLILFMTVAVFWSVASGDAWNEACHHNYLARATVFVSCGMWLLKFTYARLVIRYARVPMQLYVPKTRFMAPFRQIGLLLRTMGPV
eukprot:TRINITY_DN91370_c0_g1_i1.p1 TRINITY_DN91370_c0_g1~~TRINITY_DN91370_c0_g1_i1.p1  ORF type:complete len:507 (-),score=58.40 TRINITY_DN91370_c0_g1_i1:41-1561(-)